MQKFREVAAQLEQFFQLKRIDKAPSVRSLSRRMGVSRPTVTKAIHYLKETGAWEFDLQVTTSDSRVTDQLISPTDRLFAEIRGEIESGRYPVDTPLPKVSFFTERARIGRAGVLKVFARLVSENWLHKLGKQYIVGSPVGTDRFRRHIGNPPEILILCFDSNRWPRYCTDIRNGPFGATFVGLAQNAGYRLQQIVPSPKKTLYEVPAGKKEVSNYIRNLGRRYCGTLIVEEYRGVEDFPGWVDLLSGFRRPIIWFDRMDEGLKAPINSRWFFRFHHTERGTARAAIEYLYLNGCRNVAYPYDETVRWQVQRLDHLTSLADEYRGMRLHSWTYAPDGKPLDMNATQHYLKRFEKCHAMRPLLKRALSEYASEEDMGTDAHSISPLVHVISQPVAHHANPGIDLVRRIVRCGPFWENDPSLTLILPNDVAALAYINEMKLVDYRVPRDLSVVSFDNALRFTFTPLSSVDFGFAGLSNTAFNLLTDRSSLLSHKRRSIPARPFVTHRGSVKLLRHDP